MSDSPIDDIEKRSALGLKLKAYFQARLFTLRAKNDSCPLEQTERLRGRIREVKSILNVLEDKPAFEIESDDAE